MVFKFLFFLDCSDCHGGKIVISQMKKQATKVASGRRTAAKTYRGLVGEAWPGWESENPLGGDGKKKWGGFFDPAGPFPLPFSRGGTAAGGSNIVEHEFRFGGQVA